MMSLRINRAAAGLFVMAALLLSQASSADAKEPASWPVTRAFAGCERHFPGGVPLDLKSVDAAWRPSALCSSSFAVMYSAMTKTPMVVVERLSATSIGDARGQQRTNDFAPDSRLRAGERAELGDYQRSGFARGHMAAAANMPDKQAMSESFLLSNVVPQNFEHNAEIWSKVESATRRYVKRAEGNVFVYTGPLFLGPPRTIGRSGVWVPSHLFKLVFDETSGRAWAFIHANSSEQRMEAPVSYQDFVARTGWDLLAHLGKGAPI